jgi:hypothetical protein
MRTCAHAHMLARVHPQARASGVRGYAAISTSANTHASASATCAHAHMRTCVSDTHAHARAHAFARLRSVLDAPRATQTDAGRLMSDGWCAMHVHTHASARSSNSRRDAHIARTSIRARLQACGHMRTAVHERAPVRVLLVRPVRPVRPVRQVVRISESAHETTYDYTHNHTRTGIRTIMRMLGHVCQRLQTVAVGARRAHW